jgi:transposase
VFIGASGLLDCFSTDGTFTRHKFIDALKEFALNNTEVRTYPGKNSVWIMDGASIHCDRNITYYLRSLGIHLIFLPKYCAFYNPIELMFGMVKKRLKLNYEETKTKDIKLYVLQCINSFVGHSFIPQFRKCGYNYNSFDMDHALKTDTVFDD